MRVTLNANLSQKLTVLANTRNIDVPAMIGLLLFDYAQRNPESAAPAKKPTPKAAAPAAVMEVWAEDDGPNTVSLNDDDETLAYGD